MEVRMPSRPCAPSGVGRFAWGLAVITACVGGAESARAEPPNEALRVWTASDTAKSAAPPAQPVAGYPAPAPAAATPAWTFSVTPYLWMAGLKGDLAVSPRVPPVHPDLSFIDIANALRFGALAAVQARHDRFIADADVLYLDLKASKNIGVGDPTLVDVTLGDKTFISTVSAGYRLVDRGPLSIDVFGGLRIVDLKTDLKLAGPNRALEDSVHKTWPDPVVGAQAEGPLSGHWGYKLYGDIGGFGVNSKLTWQAIAAVQYRFDGGWRMSAGWRHLDINYNKRGFLFDAAMDGPLLEATYQF
jgi:hypothetical protein